MLAGALLFLAADSARKLANLRAATAAGEAGRPAPAWDATSPTGYRDAQRSQILESTDGYHWVMQTQRMIATGDWRVRRVDYDNAPAGREVHWNSPLHWWLALVAWADHAITGRPWLVAVESAALYANPLLLGLFLCAVVPWAARKFGAGPAALLALGLVMIGPFAAEYGAGSYDHHGVAASGALLSVLLLLAAWILPPDCARRCLVASGLAGAAGLWINAATQIPVLAGIGAGALFAGWIVRRETSPPIDPRWWRTWGLAGGGASLACYLLEYFPAHLGWRLEVNHPLYALAWAAAGDWLARLTGRMAGRPLWKPGRDRFLAGAGLLAVAIPPLLIVLAPAQTFVVADTFLWTLHVDYIGEFAPLLSRLSGHAFAETLEILLVQVSVIPLLGLVAGWLLWRGPLAVAHRALLALSLPPALLISLFSLSQLRWLHLACALWLAVLVAVAFIITATPDLKGSAARRIAAGLLLVLVLAPYPLRAAIDALRHEPGLSRENLRQFALRDLAYWLRRRTGAEPVVVLSGPTATSELVYHGGFRGIGTLYWENLAGLRALVDIYSASDPDRALALLRAHGVTHLVVLPWGSFAPEAARLAQGLRASDPVPAGTFAVNLLESGRGLPDWVRPLPYRLPETPAFKNQFALVLEITPNQGAADAAVGRAQFLLALGNAPAASDLVRQVLAYNPDHASALITLAQLQRADRQRSAHGVTMQHLRTLLATDPTLATSDRVALALELMAAGDPDSARTQLMRTWASLDPRTLRRLPPESLGVLLRLTRDLAVAAPPNLLPLAESLGLTGRAPAGP